MCVYVLWRDGEAKGRRELLVERPREVAAEELAR